MADKREQIEAAAIKAIKKDGLRSVSFRTLADTVGVKSASVHYHFPTKSDLAHAVVSEYTEGLQTRLADIDRRRRTLKGKLNGFVDIFDDVLATGDMCLCGMMASEVTALDDATRDAIRGFFAEAETWLQRTFAAHDDPLASALTPAQLARLLVSGLEGALLVDRVEGSDARLKVVRAFVASLVD